MKPLESLISGHDRHADTFPDLIDTLGLRQSTILRPKKVRRAGKFDQVFPSQRSICQGRNILVCIGRHFDRFERPRNGSFEIDIDLGDRCIPVGQKSSQQHRAQKHGHRHTKQHTAPAGQCNEVIASCIFCTRFHVSSSDRSVSLSRLVCALRVGHFAVISKPLQRCSLCHDICSTVAQALV
jgi:hypothetical protein